MLCEKCKKNPANLHLQQFVLGQKKEMHICQECAFAMSNISLSAPLESIFKGILEQIQQKGTSQSMPASSQTRSCTRCQSTYDDIKSSGKLGCDECYVCFHDEVGKILKAMQGSTRHSGKYPRRLGSEYVQMRQVGDLRQGLKKAIEEENFELAAKLRDEIRELEASD